MSCHKYSSTYRNTDHRRSLHEKKKRNHRKFIVIQRLVPPRHISYFIIHWEISVFSPGLPDTSLFCQIISTIKQHASSLQATANPEHACCVYDTIQSKQLQAMYKMCHQRKLHTYPLIYYYTQCPQRGVWLNASLEVARKYFPKGSKLQ